MKNRSKSIYQTILKSLLAVLLLEVVILLSGMYLSRAVPQLNKNSMDILKKQVENRKNFLESMMLDDENLMSVSDTINRVLQKQLEDGTVSLSELGGSEEGSVPLLKEVSSDLVALLRRKKVNGVFTVFNQEDMDAWEDGRRMYGVYIRDLDPEATYSERNSDLLLERSPVGLVKAMNISTDAYWRPYLVYDKERLGSDVIYQVFQAALKSKERLKAEDYGRWTTEGYVLDNDDESHEAIAYSMPLILPDGTVYGVLGIDILTSYLKTFLPFAELQNEGTGTYLLASTTAMLEDEEIPVRVAVSSSADPKMDALGTEAVLKRSPQGEYWMEVDGASYYAAVTPLQLYARNAPFSGEQWLLIGTVENRNLFLFAGKILRMILLMVLLMLLVGAACSVFISAHLARPISLLSEEVAEAQKNRSTIPELSRTGIRELDQFSAAFTRLSRDVLESSTKFLRIMDMASVEMGGYEVRTDVESVYVTDNFFELLGIPDVDLEGLDVARFEAVMRRFREKHPYRMRENGSLIFRIQRPDGQIRYIRMEVAEEKHAQIGLLEDVTVVTLERMRIEHERDYDSLTGIYRRQALKRECEKQFCLPETMKHAALLMLDLDNLKKLNDTYGHDWGDQYICHAARCLEEFSNLQTVCGRLSGDEFVVFFHGYDSQDEIRSQVTRMQRRIQEKKMTLPNGRRWMLQASGGISWYPEDSMEFEQLKKYADFAMYQAKKNEKGTICEFERDAYDREERVIQSRREFYKLIEEELVHYYFQPIVSARTGEAEAYEALMRVSMPTLSNPEAVMKMAREEGCLHAIEKITMFRATEAFLDLQRRGLLRGNEKLFINSIASEHLNTEEEQAFFNRFSELLDRLVIEITEEESMNMEALRIKQETLGKYAVFALDDYGTGYSNDKALLDVAPRYIKIDRCMIQDIDRDVDKQEIVAVVIAYAHPRGMYIIAEGVERREELEKVLELGVDYLQGFYLARPAAEPGTVNPEAIEIIQTWRR